MVRALARDRSRLALLALCAGHAVASLIAYPEWIFAKYPNVAERLRRGDLTPQQASDASPGYLLLNILLEPSVLRWIQAFVGAAAIVCAFRIASRARGPVAGWTAALALALAQPWLLYGAVLEPELFIAALNLSAIAALVSARRPRTVAIAGLALGASFALRPTAAPFALAALLWLFFDTRRRAASRRHILAFAGGFAVAALLPVAVLYLTARQEWRTTMSAGMVFHEGHRPEDSGVRAHYPGLMKLLEAHHGTQPHHQPDYAHELYRRFSAAAAGKPLEAPDVERFWMGKAAAFAAEKPAEFFHHLLRKWVFTVAAPSPGADIAGVQAAEQREVPSLPLRWLALAGFAGLLLAIRGGRIERLLGLYVLVYQAVYVLFYYQTRYGVALLPAWCCLAGCAASALWEARRAPKRLFLRAAVVAAPLALLLLGFVAVETRLEDRRLLVPVVSNVPALRAKGKQADALELFLDEQASFPDHVWLWSVRGNGLHAGSPETALLAAERARARFGTDDPTDCFLLAVLYANGGRCDLALPLLDKAAAAGFHGTVEDTDFSLDPDLLASDCLLEQGRRDDAFARVRRSLDRWPGTLDGLARGVAAARDDSARWTHQLFALHDPASAHFALARARRRWGDPVGAIRDAEALAALLPEAEPLADFERALSLLDLGRTDEALRAYVGSLRIKFYVYGSHRFDPLVRALVAARPDQRDVNVFALRHWFRQGEEDEIRALVNRHPDLTATFH